MLLFAILLTNWGLGKTVKSGKSQRKLKHKNNGHPVYIIIFFKHEFD